MFSWIYFSKLGLLCKLSLWMEGEKELNIKTTTNEQEAMKWSYNSWEVLSAKYFGLIFIILDIFSKKWEKY